MTADGTVVEVVVDDVVVVTVVVDVVGGVVADGVVVDTGTVVVATDVVGSLVLVGGVELVPVSDAQESSNGGATKSAHHQDRRQVTMLPALSSA